MAHVQSQFKILLPASAVIQEKSLNIFAIRSVLRSGLGLWRGRSSPMNQSQNEMAQAILYVPFDHGPPFSMPPSIASDRGI